jgi:DNA-directed RNA polymerase I, II, and III subunit RPABC1
MSLSLFLMQILVIFYGPSMIKVNSVRSIYAQIMNKETLSGLILIVQNNITNQALKAMDIWRFKVEIFQVS